MGDEGRETSGKLVQRATERPRDLVQLALTVLGMGGGDGELFGAAKKVVLEALTGPPNPRRPLESTPMQRIEQAMRIAAVSGPTEGAHHKAWVIDQMVRALGGANYDLWRAAQVKPWDTGVAP